MGGFVFSLSVLCGESGVGVWRFRGCVRGGGVARAGDTTRTRGLAWELWAVRVSKHILGSCLVRSEVLSLSTLWYKVLSLSLSYSRRRREGIERVYGTDVFHVPCGVNPHNALSVNALV